MARFVFTDVYNHRWPSRAITEFRPDPEPRTVKREVAEAAAAAGKGHFYDDDDAGDEAGEAGELAGLDDGADGTADVADSDSILADSAEDGAADSTGS